MSRISWIIKALFIGLFTTQVLATLHVHISNCKLAQTITAITKAGYFAIPNQLIVYTLKDFTPAFLGGLFFTLSIGVGLSLLSIIAAWLWNFRKNKITLFLVIGLYLSLCIIANIQGFCFMIFAYFFIIPFVVFTTSLKFIPKQSQKSPWLNNLRV